MSRIPYPNAETLSAEKRAVLAGGKSVLNISRMTMHAPDDIWLAWRTYARTVAYEIPLDIALRELIILRVGYLSRSDYEVHHHRHVALGAGATEAKCEAARTGDFGALDDRERAMLTFVTELIVDVSPSDAALAAVRARFSDELVVAVVMLVGYYMTMARVIAVGGVTPEGE